MFRFLTLLIVITACNSNVDNSSLPIIEPTEDGGVRTIVKTNEFENDEAYSIYQEGLMLIRKDKYDEAKKKYHQALIIEPNNEVLFNSLGIAEMHLAIFDSSEAHFQKAIQIKPSYTIARNNLGLLYFYYGKYEMGISILNTVPIDSSSMMIKGANYYHLFMNYTGLGECDSAIHYYHLAKEHNTNDQYLKNIEEFMQDELVFICPEFVLELD